MSEFDRVALERDEKFNTRISGYIGWAQVGINALIPHGDPDYAGRLTHLGNTEDMPAELTAAGDLLAPDGRALSSTPAVHDSIRAPRQW